MARLYYVHSTFHNVVDKIQEQTTLTTTDPPQDIDKQPHNHTTGTNQSSLVSQA